tara:strand:- start:1482 stop:1772 length:291 start_codon:yes stop_codon:yes gene_type:complete
LIRNISIFLFLFFTILIFLGFKNQIKILKSDLIGLRDTYDSELQLYLKRNIQLTKMINQFQIEEIPNRYVQKNIIKFDRSLLNKFTVIKVNYDKSE